MVKTYSELETMFYKSEMIFSLISSLFCLVMAAWGWHSVSRLHATLDQSAV